MFFHLFQYRIKKILHTKDELFWTFFFPIILGTFFYMAFGNITEQMENFSSIPVAVVMEEGTCADSFSMIADSLDANKTGEESLLDIAYTDSKKAKKLLSDEKVDGILYINDTISLNISENGLNETVLKSFTDQFLQTQHTIMEIGSTQPQKLPEVVSTLTQEHEFNKNISLTKGSLDPMLQYFYALIAMACLYGCFSGFTCSANMKADITALGARRTIAPANRMTVILADFLATLVVHFASILFLLFYLGVILKIELGSKIGFIVLTSFVGCIIGIANGIFVGSLPKLAEGLKEGVLIGITMLLCFLSGLMVSDMKIIIEHHAPIINRINPATLLTDAFFALNVYDTYGRYFMNLGILLLFAAILCLLSFFMTRRETYASL